MAYHRITLTYQDASDVVQSDPDPIKIEVGDTVTFYSDQGPVNVLLLPEGHFSASQFHAGDGPVRRLLPGATKICCGVVIDGKVWGYPEHQRFGHQIIPDSD